MADYVEKLDWEFDDDVTEDHLNRWEKGIKDAHDKVATHKTDDRATPETMGHVKAETEADGTLVLPEMELTDTVTDKVYKWGLEDGVVFLEEVVEE